MNNNIYKIGFFILLVVNVALVVFLVLEPKRSPHSQGIKDEISRELGFTEEQRTRYDEMAMIHREKVNEIEKRERILIRSFFNQLALENTSTEKEKLLDEILVLNRKKITATYTHFEQLKKICTEEQLTKFDKVISRIIPVLTNSSERPPINPGRPN